jgi:hypothetical protein
VGVNFIIREKEAPYMASVSDCLSMLRRRIGDTDTPFVFTDDLLYGFISDSVNQVELDYKRGFIITSSVDNTDPSNPVTTYSFSNYLDGTLEPGVLDLELFVVKAHFNVVLRTKVKADRDNFRMVKGRLTLDNTNQAGDHKDTLEILDREYRKTLLQIKNNGQIKGVRLE